MTDIENIEISVIVPVENRFDSVEEIYRHYEAGLMELGRSYEFIFVLDGPRQEFANGLKKLEEDGKEFSVVQLSRWFGEAAALMAGFETSRGRSILTLPAYFQVESSEFQDLFVALENADLVICRRHPRRGSAIERLRRRIFHGLLSWITHLRFNDLGCSVRAMRREVLGELKLYGDQQRFLPVLANHQGFRVQEMNVRQSERDVFKGRYPISDYARSFLDLITVFFLVRFTKKPLRFFGMLGAFTSIIGGVIIATLVFQRVFFEQALGTRPALLLASLLVVLGLQLFALGLLGELIIFTHARDLKDYKVDRIVHFPASDQNPTA